MQTKKIRKSPGDITFAVINYTVFAIFTLLCVFPFYYLLINTISDNQLAAQGLILFFPKGIHFDNYIQVMQIKGLGQAGLISLGRTVIGTLCTVAGTAFLGYALSKQEMWGRKFWYRYVVITMYFQAGLIPGFINMKNLGLTNNFLAYIVPAIVSPFSLILFKTYVESIPASLEESAELDGAGYLTCFIRIIVPLAKPIIATIAVFAAVGQWNSFMDTLLYMTNSKLYSLQFVLYQYLNEANAIANMLQMAQSSGMQIMDPSKLLTTTSIKMTVSIVVVVPILLVYPFFQRFFVKGIMIGAVKG